MKSEDPRNPYFEAIALAILFGIVQVEAGFLAIIIAAWKWALN